MNELATGDETSGAEETPVLAGRLRPKSLIVMDARLAAEVYGPANIEEIAAHSHLLVPLLDPRDAGEWRRWLRETEVLFIGWGPCPRADAAFLRDAPQLQAIFFAGGTTRHWLTPAVFERGITVTSAHGANAIPVAEYALATILFSLKRGWHYLAVQHRENVFPAPIVPSPGAYESFVGVIGLGAVGQRLCEMLRPFDLEVLAFDPFLSPESARMLGVRLTDLDTVFRQCDVVSAHAPLLEATRGMLQARHFRLMQPGATFINTARGGIVRQREMAEVLQERRDLTAVLDVLEVEPPPADDPLLKLPNVMLTPHVAGALGRERRRLGRMVIDEFQRWRRGLPLRGEITPQNVDLLA